MTGPTITRSSALFGLLEAEGWTKTVYPSLRAAVEEGGQRVKHSLSWAGNNRSATRWIDQVATVEVWAADRAHEERHFRGETLVVSRSVSGSVVRTTLFNAGSTLWYNAPLSKIADTIVRSGPTGAASRAAYAASRQAERDRQQADRDRVERLVGDARELLGAAGFDPAAITATPGGRPSVVIDLETLLSLLRQACDR